MTAQAYAEALLQELQASGVRRGKWKEQGPQVWMPRLCGTDCEWCGNLERLGEDGMASVCPGPAVIVQPVVLDGCSRRLRGPGYLPMTCQGMSEGFRASFV